MGGGHGHQLAHAGLVQTGEGIGLVDLVVVVGAQELAGVVTCPAPPSGCPSPGWPPPRPPLRTPVKFLGKEGAPNPFGSAHVPAVICANHGPFTWGKDAAKAVYHAVVLEEVAKMATYTELHDRPPSWAVRPAPTSIWVSAASTAAIPPP